LEYRANEYALANRIEHPKTVYVREAEIVPRLDEWLAQLFEPDQLDETLEMLLASAQGLSAAEEAIITAARRTLADCDAKLERYRAALEAGTDPAVVSRWIREVTQLREQARREVRHGAAARRSSKDELQQLIEDAGDIVRTLAEADPKRKSELYASLGLDLLYDHEEKRVIVEADLAVCQDRVGGGI
jgi:site-specific DNA recombinase